MYTKIRAEMGMVHFDEHMASDVLELFSRATPRELRKNLMSALGRAELARRNCLTTDDLKVSTAGVRRSIGF
jgi:hypothetical protein